ncbi:MAG: hypothetical protein HY242_11115 [Afipia sp.]|nr:hypothetical protein [Afipia sp.]
MTAASVSGTREFDDKRQRKANRQNLWGPMGAMSSPILIVGLIVKAHLIQVNDAELPAG